MNLKKSLLFVLLAYASAANAAEWMQLAASDVSAADSSATATSKEKTSKDKATQDKAAEEAADVKTHEVTGLQSAAEFFAAPIAYNPASLNLPTLSGAQGINPLGGRRPATVEFYGLQFLPTFGVNYGHNDNVTKVGTGETSSSFVTYTPQLLALIDKGSNKYTLAYNASLTHYTHASRNDLDNHNLIAFGLNTFNARNKLNWAMSISKGMDQANMRGGEVNVARQTPDDWNMQSVKGVYTYGAQGAKGNVDLKTQYINKEYTNNRARTEIFDFDSFMYGAEFNYGISPKTQVVLDLNQTKTDYKSALSLQDNTDTRYLVGVKWRALAKTEGFFKVGRQEKNFDSSGIQDQSGASYEGGFRWQPKTYSNVDFKLSRAILDAAAANFVAGSTDGYTVNWTHAWKNYFRTTMTGTYTTAKFDANGVSANREDKTKVYGISALYDVTRWAGLGLSYTRTNKDSTDALFKYDNDLYYFSVNLNL